MKLTMNKPVEVVANAIRCIVPFRYDEEDIPNDFPLRVGDVWSATIELATGRIFEWPTDAGAKDLHIKVCDEGVYTLLTADGDTIAERNQEYVPGCFPNNHYGDYIIFTIGADGVIANWSHNATPNRVASFFGLSGDDD